jgi:hypothetical protein
LQAIRTTGLRLDTPAGELKEAKVLLHELA